MAFGTAPGFAFVVSGNTLRRVRPAPAVSRDLQMTTPAMIPIKPQAGTLYHRYAIVKRIICRMFTSGDMGSYRRMLVTG